MTRAVTLEDDYMSQQLGRSLWVHESDTKCDKHEDKVRSMALNSF